MVITKHKDVTKQGFCKYSEENAIFGEVLLELIQFLGVGRGKVGGVGVGALLSLRGIGREVGWGGVGAYSRPGAY